MNEDKPVLLPPMDEEYYSKTEQRVSVLVKKYAEYFNAISAKYKVEYCMFIGNSDVYNEYFLISTDTEWKVLYIRKNKLGPVGIPSGFVTSYRMEDCPTHVKIKFIQNAYRFVKEYFNQIVSVWGSLDSLILQSEQIIIKELERYK